MTLIAPRRAPEEYAAYVDALIAQRKEVKRQKANAKACRLRAADPEKYRAAALRYRDANLDKVRAYARNRKRELRAQDPEREAEYQRAWRQANPEKVRNRKREWDLKNPEKVRAMRLKKTYGITPTEWDALFASQGNACGSCGRDTPNAKGIWVTDHCHKTGKVRGILCSFCNSMLGYAEDNPENLLKAADYLRRSQAGA